MATAADPSSSYSPSSSPSYSSARSPRFRRNSPNAPSPWSHVVRCETSPPPSAAAEAAAVQRPEPSDRSPRKIADSGDPTEAGTADAAGAPPPPPRSEITDHGSTGDASASSREKKSAWNRPSNGSIEAGAVMWADSWPALSEATKAPQKSSSYDSLKGLSNGSIPDPPAPVPTSPPPKPVHSNTNYNSSANHAVPTRQKSMKWGGNSSTGSMITAASNNAGGLAHGGPVQPKSQSTLAVSSHNKLDKPVNSEPSPRELAGRSGNWDHGSRVGGFSPQSQGGSEHQKNYSGNRRSSNTGGGGGQHHNNFGNRHEQERGSYEWGHRSFSGGREMQIQQQQQQQQQPRAIARPFLRPPPPGSAPFIAPPPPIRPFVNPIGYPDIPPPLIFVPTHPPHESFRGMPFVPPPGMIFSSDLQLRTMLLKQIDYYFSSENLCKDVYLRQNMDEEGWVPISLIAGFNRVRSLTTSIQFILETVRTSTTVEVQGDKIRRRNDWKNWPPLAATPNLPHSPTMQNYDPLAARLTHIGLEEGGISKSSIEGTVCTEVGLSRSSSGEFTTHSQVAASTRDRLGQSAVRNGSDRSVFARSLGRSDTF